MIYWSWIVHEIYFSCAPGGHSPEFTATFSETGLGEPEGDVHGVYSSVEEMVQSLKSRGISMGCSGPTVLVPVVLMDQIAPECQERGWRGVSTRQRLSDEGQEPSKSSLSGWFALGE